MCGCAARRRCGRLVRENCSKRNVFRRGSKHETVPVKLIMKKTTIAIAPLLCAAALLAPAIGAGNGKPIPFAGELPRPAEPSPRITADRTGFVPTADGLMLRLTADLGSVKIVAAEGSPEVVRYTVHLETDARASVAQHLLDRYSLVAKSTPAGVEITGNLPPQAAHLSGAQFYVQFEIAVPRNYSVEVNTGAGDIETGDIGGIATLVTSSSEPSGLVAYPTNFDAFP